MAFWDRLCPCILTDWAQKAVCDSHVFLIPMFYQRIDGNTFIFSLSYLETYSFEGLHLDYPHILTTYGQWMDGDGRIGQILEGKWESITGLHLTHVLLIQCGCLSSFMLSSLNVELWLRKGSKVNLFCMGWKFTSDLFSYCFTWIKPQWHLSPEIPSCFPCYCDL